MTALEISIIGAGRLGKTVGRLLVENGCGVVTGICNRSIESAGEAIRFIGQGEPCSEINALPPSDLILIACSDDAIEPCARQLAQSPGLRSTAVVVHFSGSLSSDILDDLRKNGCAVGSLHPMHSFAEPSVSVTQFVGTYCAIEGDARATQLLRQLFGKLGAILFQVNAGQKSLYHAAGVIASNYVVTLFDRALYCLEQSGVQHDVAPHLVLNLMRGTVHNLSETSSSREALTGPIKRGDAATVAQHLAAFPNEQLIEIYQALGRATLDIADLNPAAQAGVMKALR